MSTTQAGKRTYKREHNSVLPMGSSAKLEVGKRGDKVIDHSNALPMFRKKTGNKMQAGSNIFGGPEPSVKREAKRQDLHTDPFAMDRKHNIPPKKVLRQPKVSEPHKTGIMHLKPYAPDRHEFVTSNGLVFKGGKVVNDRHYQMTLNDDQPAKNCAAMARFAAGSKNKDSDPNAPAPRHRGIKRVEGHNEAAQKTLVGVLRTEAKKPARNFNYRPPWGTCNTPRAAVGSKQATYAPPTPWAVSA